MRQRDFNPHSPVNRATFALVHGACAGLAETNPFPFLLMADRPDQCYRMVNDCQHAIYTQFFRNFLAIFFAYSRL